MRSRRRRWLLRFRFLLLPESDNTKAARLAAMQTISLRLKSALAGLGSGDALVEVRLTDTDCEPETGPYFDVAVSARIRYADYRDVVAWPGPQMS